MTDLMDRLYGKLPDIYRLEDERQGFPLKTWLAPVVDMAGAIDDLHTRFNYATPAERAMGEDGNTTSDLVDPATADDAWLTWIAQILGVKAPAGLDFDGLRAFLLTNGSRHLPGTVDALTAVVKTVLVGDQQVNIFPRTISSGNIGGGGQWDLLIVTRTSETLDQLMPELLATTATLANFSCTNGKLDVNPEPSLYKSRSIKQTVTTAGTLTFSMRNSGASDRIAVAATDPYAAFMTYWALQPGSWSGTLSVAYYNSGGSLISSVTQAVTINQTIQQFNVQGNAPTGAVTALLQMSVAGTTVGQQFAAAQLGMREGSTNTWNPRPADPIKAVIDAGAKPAGIVLHHDMDATTWDNLETSLPAWTDWEARTWDQIEEEGLG